MPQNNLRKFYIIGGILGVILLGFFVWLVVDVHSLYHRGMLKPSIAHAHHNRVALTSPAQIQDWMTFHYINYIFRLPPTYLSQTLKISDAYYPNLVISTYAASHKLNSAAFLESVKQAVATYPLGGSQ